MNLIDIRQRFNEAGGRKKQLEDSYTLKETHLESLTVQRDDNVKARWVLSEVSRLTQERFKDRVEKLVTMAVRSVFDRDFSFELIFERKRNKLECQPIIKEKGNELIPKDAMGGSVLDIISFAFRIVLWSIEKPKSRNVFLMDEPGKWTGKLVVKFGEMMREVSHRLGFQIIMPTHDDSLIEIADRAWHIEHDGTKSVVKLVSGEEKEEEVKPKRKLRRRR